MKPDGIIALTKVQSGTFRTLAFIAGCVLSGLTGFIGMSLAVRGNVRSAAAAKTEVDLVVVSAVELGLTTDSASLRDIYSRAEKLGLSPAPAEVGPELRLQYFDQPIGEFLYVEMKPITTWTGDPVIFVVVNGGAGLILIGQNGSADTQIPASSAFLFVRPRELPKVAKGQPRPTDEIQ